MFRIGAHYCTQADPLDVRFGDLRLVEDGRCQALFLIQERQQQVFYIHLRLTAIS